GATRRLTCEKAEDQSRTRIDPPTTDHRARIVGQFDRDGERDRRDVARPIARRAQDGGGTDREERARRWRTRHRYVRVEVVGRGRKQIADSRAIEGGGSGS